MSGSLVSRKYNTWPLHTCNISRPPILIENLSLMPFLLPRQGSEDVPFSYKVAKEEIKLFTNSSHAELRIIEGGGHYLNATHPVEIARGLAEFVGKFHGAS